MNELFNFEGNNVEVIVGKNGEPLFEIYSTGMALGHVKIAKGKAYPRKDRIDKNIKNAEISTVVHSGQQYITEEQLYDFMLECKTEKCKPFRKWVTHEVLPQIRKTGGYIPIQQEDDEATIMAKALVIAQNTLSKKDELIKEMQPKANWFDSFLSSEGTYNSTQVAKLFKISSAKKLNQLLNENKIIYKQGKNWYTYFTVDKSWYKLIVGNSNEHPYSQLKWTPEGIYEISKILNIEFTEEDLEKLA